MKEIKQTFNRQNALLSTRILALSLALAALRCCGGGVPGSSSLEDTMQVFFAE